MNIFGIAFVSVAVLLLIFILCFERQFWLACAWMINCVSKALFWLEKKL